LSAASFWAARRAFYRHLTAWRVASATCSTHAGFNESHAVGIAVYIADLLLFMNIYATMVVKS